MIEFKGVVEVPDYVNGLLFVIWDGIPGQSQFLLSTTQRKTRRQISP